MGLSLACPPPPKGVHAISLLELPLHPSLPQNIFSWVLALKPTPFGELPWSPGPW